MLTLFFSSSDISSLIDSNLFGRLLTLRLKKIRSGLFLNLLIKRGMSKYPDVLKQFKYGFVSMLSPK